MSIEILAAKLLDVMGTYRHLSHTVLNCIIFWCLMLVAVT